MSRAKPQPHPLGALLRPVRALVAGVRRAARALVRRLVRQPSHLVRVLGRLRTRARARRQDKTKTDIP